MLSYRFLVSLYSRFGWEWSTKNLRLQALLSVVLFVGCLGNVISWKGRFNPECCESREILPVAGLKLPAFALKKVLAKSFGFIITFPIEMMKNINYF